VAEERDGGRARRQPLPLPLPPRGGVVPLAAASTARDHEAVEEEEEGRQGEAGGHVVGLVVHACAEPEMW